MTKNKALLHTLILLFLSSHVFSQSIHKITFGDLGSARISVEEFRNQKQLKLPEGISLDSAFVYFSIPGRDAIAKVEYFPKFDSIRFSKYSDMLIPGATAMFNVFVTDKNGKSFPIDVGYVFNSMKKQDTSFNTLPQHLEIEKLAKHHYLSGTIYFSGSNFPNVRIFRIGQGKTDDLEKLFERCVAGTVISFENVSYKDEEGNTGKVHKSMKL